MTIHPMVHNTKLHLHPSRTALQAFSPRPPAEDIPQPTSHFPLPNRPPWLGSARPVKQLICVDSLAAADRQTDRQQTTDNSHGRDPGKGEEAGRPADYLHHRPDARGVLSPSPSLQLSSSPVEVIVLTAAANGVGRFRKLWPLPCRSFPRHACYPSTKRRGLGLTVGHL